MLVDDSIANIRVLNNILQDLGEIYFATSGQAAIAMAREKKPDLILLDVEMPNMDGYEACSILKSDPELAQAAIIFVTGHSGAEYEIKALEAGGIDFITKPLNPPVVRARVNTHLTLKAQSDLLRMQASVDGLTGAYNRRIFDERLDEECRRHRRYEAPLGLAIVDVDRFKQYNDSYGHPAGDACLQQIAKTLKRNARRPGELVARYGGEEFALILPACTLDDARSLGERLCQAVRELAIPHNQSAADGIVTISVGVASLLPAGAESASTLLAAADMALYQAKHAGRNRVVAEPLPVAPAPDKN